MATRAFFLRYQTVCYSKHAHNAPIQITAVLWRDWKQLIFYVFNIRTRCYSLIRSHSDGMSFEHQYSEGTISSPANELKYRFHKFT